MDKDKIEQKEARLQETQRYWDREAANFDDEPDHGLRDPSVFEAWRSLLNAWLPPAPCSVLDIGCGTGSLSVLLASSGYAITGIDLSPVMIEVARAKAVAKGFDVRFLVMDAAYPDLNPRQFDILICRHLLWALPEPEKALQRWAELQNQPGTLVLVEGFWGTGAGLHTEDVLKIIPSSFTNVRVENLSDQPALWGKKVTDERYAIIAEQHE
jgi:2-polyprenyl-3-methyl-5-hydroxy-6-metoxy-1,4-benzoquinol methylase